MNRLSRLFAFAACAVSASMLIAACGGGDAEPPPSAVNQPTTAPAPDTAAPTLSIFSDLSGATATGPVTFSFIFNEDVGTSFAIGDVTVSGGTAGALAKVSATQYTLVVTPAGGTGTLGVRVAAGTFSDLAGNINTVAPAAVQLPYDTQVKTQMALPVTFDSPTTDYGFIGFGGAEDSNVVVDPTDATNKVARVVRAAGSETYAGTTITAAAGLGFSPKVPFNANDTRMSVRVWSPDANIPVRLKVEDHTDPNKSVEAEVTVTTAAGWQTLTFNFAPGSQVAGTAAINFAYNYDKATIFFDFGRAKASAVQKTYYFDDVTLVPGTAGGGGGGGTTKTQMSLPVNFDSTTVDYGFIGFGGAEDSSVVVDPTNAANKVAKVVRAAGAESYAGTTITGAAGLGFSPKIPFTATDTRMSVRVWSPDANIPVRLKVEDHTDPTKSVETEATVTTAAGWQTLTFNFANGSQASGTAAINLAFNYDKATLFFDFGRAKASAVQKTYYFDDVAFVPGAAGGGGAGATAPTVAAATPPARAAGDVLSVFSDAYTPISGIDLNPNWGQSTVPTTELIAGNATRKYANLNYQGIDFSSNPINVSSMTRLHIDVWTANVTNVLVSIISAGQENAVTLTPTLAGWNSFDIDLAQYTVPNKAAIIQIKIEGTPSGGTLYFDNLYFWKPAAGGGGGGGAALVTFDEATAPKLTDFGTNGAGASIVTDPAGGTNKVMLVNKYLTPTQSEQWAGTTVSTGANDSIPTLPFTASAKTMTLRVYSPAVGVRVRLKVEDASNPGVSVETDAITTTSGAWEVLTFNFANPGTSPPVGGGATSPLDLSKTYNKLSVFMDFGIGNGGSANLPGNRVYYVDDITFVSAP